MIRLFLFVLWLWGLGLLFFFPMALSYLAFGGPWKDFFKSIPVLLLWPLTLFSSKGRATLFRVFRNTQGPSS